MAGYVRLQPLTQLTASDTQRTDAAVDLGDFGSVTAQVRVSVPGSVGSLLQLQHAAELEDDALTDLVAVPLDGTGSQVIVLPPALRYLRWRATLTGQPVIFLVDLVGREGAPGSQLPRQVIKTDQTLDEPSVTTLLEWNAEATVAVACEAFGWDDEEHAIVAPRTGVITIHYNIAASNQATAPALVNARTWIEEYDGVGSWNQLEGSESFVWAAGGTHGATLKRIVYSPNRKYRVQGVFNTGGGST